MTQEMFGRAMPLLMLLGAGPLAWTGEPQAAPVNPYKGMQTREEVFEFAEKPAVQKKGDKWIISFASKGRCDATVAIVDKDGKIVRHLASGVLGRNAPHPFQQDSLSQRLEWDGLKDDFSKADPAGCTVRVSLGLKATYERSMLWHPHTIPGDKGSFFSGTGPDGNLYVGGAGRAVCQGRVFDKNGKYLRTFCPAPAAEVEKHGKPPPSGYGGMVVQERYVGVIVRNRGIPPVIATAWGDKVMVSGWFGPYTNQKVLAALFAREGVKDAKRGPRPAALPAEDAIVASVARALFAKLTRLAVDLQEELLYAGFATVFRFNGRTGEFDSSWFPNGEMGSNLSEFYVTPHGVLCVRAGGSSYGQHMFRVDRAGRLVPFKKNTVAVPEKGWWEWRPKAFKGGDLGAVFTGVAGHSNTFQQGLHVAPSGLIITNIHEVSWQWAKAHGLPGKRRGKEIGGTFTAVWNPEGEMLTANAVDGRIHGHGVSMDRDGNAYIVQGGVLPAGQTSLDGTPGFRAGDRVQGGFGTLIKFRGQGGKFPVGKIVWSKEAAPADAVKLNRGYAVGALWAYGGITGQSGGDCSCHHQRYDMDPWARIWIPATHLYSVMVLDSNGNRIARLGRYGNVDDTEEDVKAGRDGLRFCWPRATAASNTALYVSDTGNRRILKAALSYEVEESVNLEPGKGDTR